MYARIVCSLIDKKSCICIVVSSKAVKGWEEISQLSTWMVDQGVRYLELLLHHSPDRAEKARVLSHNGQQMSVHQQKSS